MARDKLFSFFFLFFHFYLFILFIILFKTGNRPRRIAISFRFISGRETFFLWFMKMADVWN